MKPDIHPRYITCTVTCGCGETFQTRATVPAINVEICSACHPFYTGKQKFVDTAGRVEKFQRKDGPPVFLISLKAGGSGLTLTEADTVIHYDPWWNPAVEDQATDRAHRIGQEKPVFVYRLVMEDTVEQKMVELGQEKRRIAESALGRDTTTGKKLTMADVERLLETPATDPWQDL